MTGYKIKSCPFCLGPAQVVEDAADHDAVYVMCDMCDARGPEEFEVLDAVAAWNHRPNAKADRTEVRGSVEGLVEIALEVVKEHGKEGCRISAIQQRCRVTYPEAHRIVAKLIKDGRVLEPAIPGWKYTFNAELTGPTKEVRP